MRSRLIGGLAGTCMALAMAPSGAGAATIAVTTDTDSVSADGLCSLREAITSANKDDAGGSGCASGSGTDTIQVPAGRYTLTIPGGGTEAGDLNVFSDMTIAGAGASSTILDGNATYRIMEIDEHSTVTVSGVTITDGKAPGAELAEIGTRFNEVGHAGIAGGFGGGICNFGTLTLDSSIVQGNRAGGGGPGDNSVGFDGATGQSGGVGVDGTGGLGGLGGWGGGIYSLGTLTVTNSTITDNVAGNGGLGGEGRGGDGGVATNGNGGEGGKGTAGAGGAGGVGGGIAAFGELTIRTTVISSNRAGNGGASGGAVDGAGSNAAVNGEGGFATFAKGTAAGQGGSGGGVATGAKTTIEDTTISSNTAGRGGDSPSVVGSPAGFGAGGKPGGAGGFTSSGDGGAGGSGGGLFWVGALNMQRDSVFANRAGNGGNSGNATAGEDRPGSEPKEALAGAGAGGAGGSGGGIGGSGTDPHSLSDLTIDSNTTGSGGNAGNGLGKLNRASGGNGGAVGAGGGIGASSSPIALARSTISANVFGTAGVAGQGNGINGTGGASGTAGALAAATGTTVASSIFFQDASPMCSGTIEDALNNFKVPNSASCPGTNTDPQLEPLADNGGSTLTRAIPANSPAVDRYACTGKDQRGVARPTGSACDIGAYEVALPLVTGSPSAEAGATTATLKIPVLPNARARVAFDYGAGTGYGATSESVIADSRGTSVIAAVVVNGLAPSTTYHFRARVTNGEGGAQSDDATFTTAAAPPGSGASPDTTAPRISGFQAAPSTFAVGKAAVKSVALLAKATPVGTKLRFSLSEAATVKVTVAKRVCRFAKLKNGKRSKHKTCHYPTAGILSLRSKSGANTARFSGRFGSRHLSDGTYRLTAVATDAAGNHSKAAIASVHVVALSKAK